METSSPTPKTFWTADKKKANLLDQFDKVANSSLAFVIDPNNVDINQYRAYRNSYVEELSKHIETVTNSGYSEQVKKIELDYLLNVIRLNVLPSLRNELVKKVL